MTRRYQRGGDVVTATARADGGAPGAFAVMVGEAAHALVARATPGGGLLLRWPDGRQSRAAVTRDGRTTWVSLDGQTWRIEEAEAVGSRGAGQGGLEAPMPGKVLEVAVAVGDTVTAGQILVIIEAMKMEHAIRAPHAGTVTAVAAAEGAMVNPGAPLVSIAP